MKRLLPFLLLLVAGPALGQNQSVKLDLSKPAPSEAAAAAPAKDAAGPMTTLLLRGLDKITGRPTDITAPIGKPVNFATLL